jgi:hypothetical protein
MPISAINGSITSFQPFEPALKNPSAAKNMQESAHQSPQVPGQQRKWRGSLVSSRTVIELHSNTLR